MGYKEGKREVTSQVRAVPLGQKRKRGRPKGLGNCLLRSPPQPRESPPSSTQSHSLESPATSLRSPSTPPESPQADRAHTSSLKTPSMPKVTTRRGRKRKQTKTPTKSPSSSGFFLPGFMTDAEQNTLFKCIELIIHVKTSFLSCL